MTPHLQPGHEDPNVPGHDPDDVMDLLARVESQFDRIRSIRRRQDDAVHTLAARTEALDDAEEQLRRREQALLDESTRRDAEYGRELESQLEAIRHASNLVARRGRRIRTLVDWMEHAQKDRRRLRRRLTGLRQAVRRMLHERDRLHDEHAAATASALHDRETIEQLRSQLSLAASKITTFSEALAEQTERLEEGAAAMAEADALRMQNQRLQQSLDEARRQPVPDPIAALEPAVPAAPANDEHLERRRRRLRSCRRLLREQARRLPQMAQLEAARRKQEAHLMEQQLHLDEVRQVLTSSEERMIQRWAASRALQMTGWCVLLLLLLGAGSWWAADRFDPPSMLASVKVHAAVPPGRDKTPESLRGWTDWHVHLVRSSGFADKLAARYQEQTGIAIDPELVVHRLDEQLGIDTAQPGVLEFSMVGRTGDGTKDWLDALVRSLVSESARTARSRPNPLLAQSRNRFSEDGRERMAKFIGPPIDDTRLRTSMLIFFAAGIATLVVAVSLFSHFVGSSRVMTAMAPEPLLSDIDGSCRS